MSEDDEVRTIGVLLVDDHDLVRAGIGVLIGAMPGIRVVGEAGNGRDALALARKLQPDVALVDIAMADLNGLDATARLTHQSPACAVIILSMHTTQAYVLEAMRAGACGYLPKNCAIEELERAIRTVAGGGKYLSSAASEHLVGEIRHQGRSGADAPRHSEDGELTVRQREVLQLIAEGSSTREIAEALHLSIKTVETHRAKIKDRLDIHDVAGLTRYAIRAGLVSAE